MDRLRNPWKPDRRTRGRTLRRSEAPSDGVAISLAAAIIDTSRRFDVDNACYSSPLNQPKRGWEGAHLGPYRRS